MMASKTRVSDWMSDLLYQSALKFERPFTLDDLVMRGANAERRQVALQWLNDLEARGELTRTDRLNGTFFEWVN